MEFNAGDLDRARELFQEVSAGSSLDLRGPCGLRGSRLGGPQRWVHEGDGSAREGGEVARSGSGFRGLLLAKCKRLGSNAIMW